MRTRSTLATTTVLVATLAWLAGCGPTKAPRDAATATTAPAASSPPAAGTQTAAAKTVTAGNCTLYPKTDAVRLLGAVNMNNRALDIGTDGGTRIDVCSYLDAKSLRSIQGTTYAVVKYDSAATAFAKAQKVQTEMLGSAADHNWSVQSLVTPVPGTGMLLGGTASKHDQGVTFTIAVVGTNVGPYLVAALGASTDNPADAKRYALTVFQALSSTVS